MHRSTHIISLADLPPCSAFFRRSADRRCWQNPGPSIPRRSSNSIADKIRYKIEVNQVRCHKTTGHLHRLLRLVQLMSRHKRRDLLQRKATTTVIAGTNMPELA